MQRKNDSPINLEEAMYFVIHDCPSEQFDEFKKWASLDEKDAVCNVHLAGGMKLRNTLELWHDNDLTKWFNSIGIVHADDMSGIIFTSTHRKLNQKEIELNKQIKVYQDHWKQYGFPDGIPKKK